MDFRPYVGKFLSWVDVHQPLFWERGVVVSEQLTESDIDYLGRFPWLRWVTIKDESTLKIQIILVPEWEKKVSYRLGKAWITKEKEKETQILKLR